MFRKSKPENKAKIEHKLYLARETPEPVFDLSECDLKQVPQGIYSLCRVFLKEILRLENNCLSSLSGGGQLKDLHGLRILDLHNNAFAQLPDDVHLLKNLRELYLNDNQLKRLPDTFCHLTNLILLNLANNSLKALPSNFGNLINLKLLNISNNQHLQHLPKSMCKNQKLTSLELDSHNFVYPPAHIAALDAKAIVKFICEDVGEDFVENVEPDSGQDQRMKYQADQTDAMERQKLQDFLEMEKANELSQRQEFELASAQKVQKQKLLRDIAHEQSKFDKKIMQVHQMREAERFMLVEQLLDAEQNADKAIKQLLELNSEPLAQLLEQEKQDEERLIAAATKYNSQLRKTDVIKNMEEILQQELVRFQQFDKHRIEVSQSILQEELQSENHLNEVLQDHDNYKSELVSKLQVDSDLQRAAVGALLERGDARSWGLIQQVKLVESQLAALTHIEIDRRKLQMDEQLNDLCDKRLNLSILLTELLAQQNERRNQLLSTLKTLQDHNEQQMEDFWLRQYQQLLDKLPCGISEAQKNIDPTLAQALLLNGVFHCLPFLAKLIQSQYDITNVSEEDLIEAGIRNGVDRTHVMDAFRMYIKEKVINREVSEPSAPQLSVEEASAPPTESTGGMETECVVCMDCICEVIYVPCGHLCCCANCATSLLECPMCRAQIERKIKVITS